MRMHLHLDIRRSLERHDLNMKSRCFHLLVWAGGGSSGIQGRLSTGLIWFTQNWGEVWTGLDLDMWRCTIPDLWHTLKETSCLCPGVLVDKHDFNGKISRTWLIIEPPTSMWDGWQCFKILKLDCRGRLAFPWWKRSDGSPSTGTAASGERLLRWVTQLLTGTLTTWRALHESPD